MLSASNNSMILWLELSDVSSTSRTQVGGHETGITYISATTRGERNILNINTYKETVNTFMSCIGIMLCEKQLSENQFYTITKLVSIVLQFSVRSVFIGLVWTSKTGKGDCLVCMYCTCEIPAILTTNDNFLIFHSWAVGASASPLIACWLWFRFPMKTVVTILNTRLPVSSCAHDATVSLCCWIPRACMQPLAFRC